jgi:hypothetical protein
MLPSLGRLPWRHRAGPRRPESNPHRGPNSRAPQSGAWTSYRLPPHSQSRPVPQGQAWPSLIQLHVRPEAQARTVPSLRPRSARSTWPARPGDGAPGRPRATGQAQLCHRLLGPLRQPASECGRSSRGNEDSDSAADAPPGRDYKPCLRITRTGAEASRRVRLDTRTTMVIRHCAKFNVLVHWAVPARAWGGRGRTDSGPSSWGSERRWAGVVGAEQARLRQIPGIAPVGLHLAGPRRIHRGEVWVRDNDLVAERLETPSHPFAISRGLDQQPGAGPPRARRRNAPARCGCAAR